MKKPFRPKQLVLGSLIAAVYVVLTFVSSSLGLAFGALQLRISEALTVLPLYTPSAIWGLTLGCVLSNLQSPLGVVDIIFGSLATLIATVGTYLLRNVKPRIFALLCPVLSNAIIVGAELSYLVGEGFWFNALFVGLGEAVSVIVFSYPLIKALDKNNIFERMR